MTASQTRTTRSTNAPFQVTPVPPIVINDMRVPGELPVPPAATQGAGSQAAPVPGDMTTPGDAERSPFVVTVSTVGAEWHRSPQRF